MNEPEIVMHCFENESESRFVSNSVILDTKADQLGKKTVSRMRCPRIVSNIFCAERLVSFTQLKKLNLYQPTYSKSVHLGSVSKSKVVGLIYWYSEVERAGDFQDSILISEVKSEIFWGV